MPFNLFFDRFDSVMARPGSGVLWQVATRDYRLWSLRISKALSASTSNKLHHQGFGTSPL
jgi:hypothetical protein